MNIIVLILVTIVAVEHFYIMYLETFIPSSKKTADTFNIPVAQLQDPQIITLFKNQGIYNGLLGASLLYAAYFSHNHVEMSAVLLTFIILAAIYGSLTASRSIIFKQGAPAIIALIVLLLTS